ncbi:FGGY family carbohydrate kinase [Allostreptomyces psammosilenae]|uniref:Xylulokinase n=1 Tax=Allostreptomyces psammosilenae TaxID=1892865 RepID=A0A853A7R3_9ACTN|nr:FGGY family carbohydrate kinase [Allostreptomyces psammosilenae]NYI06701.1 xylulokinase [Allostreptomyces psammosilenae]
MAIVAGIDCSTTHTTVVVCDAETGQILRSGRAAHARPGGQTPPAPDLPMTETDPDAWLMALGEAARSGMLEGVQAIGVSAQQHGMVAMDPAGVVLRPALLWNDQRSAAAALDLVEELGGPGAWAEAVGAVPQAAYTVSKLRWLRDREPHVAQRVAEVLLPHDWITWQLLGRPARRTTDRGDASGTGYWSPVTGTFRPDLAAAALGHHIALPDVLAPAEPAGYTPEGLLISAGTGETMAVALGLGVRPGDAVISLEASGTVYAPHPEPLLDASGTVASFADATGRHLPLVSTLNAAGVLHGAARMLGVDLAELSRLALRSTPGAFGLVLLPYLEGERVPDLPDASGTLTGLRGESMAPEHLARAAVEGLACGMAEALDVLRLSGVRVDRVFLLGEAAQLPAVRQIMPLVLGVPVVVPTPGPHAAVGAARQAAWSLAAAVSGAVEPPPWSVAGSVVAHEESDHAVGLAVREQFVGARRRLHPEMAAAVDRRGRHRRF